MMMCYKRNILFIVFLLKVLNILCSGEFCRTTPQVINNNDNCWSKKHLSRNRYILYDVNPFEGFNLRRDVYIRVAVFLKKLAESDDEYNWILVLPPWGNLYHWRSEDIGEQVQIPWRLFFDVKSLEKFAPVIEMDDFFQEYESENGEIIIDHVYILQNDPEMFKTGNFNEKNEISSCRGDVRMDHQRQNKKRLSRYFWGFSNITAKEIKCITFHGPVSNLVKNLHSARVSRSFMFDHMEIPLHDLYGSKDFWKARRSMRYNRELYKLADEFREQYLNSTDIKDRIKRPDDWRVEKKYRGAVGGPYVAVHLRRQDFVRSKAESVPTIMQVAKQLSDIMRKLGLETIFIATDADNDEFIELKSYLHKFKVHKYKPSYEVKKKFKDGGIAIIDQIICSNARFFIGTHESTFSYRIQEDREILGFPITTTFNSLCSKTMECHRESRWEVVW